MTNINTSVTIIPYAGQTRDDFTPLFSEYTYGRYCSDWSLDVQASRRLELDQLYSYIQQNPENCWLAIEGNNVIGLVGVRLSKWDTEFWGIRYANIDHLITIGSKIDLSNTVVKGLVQEADHWCRNEKIAFASARADAFDLSTVHALEEQGFRYIETTITNSFSLKALDPDPSKEYEIRLAHPDEMDFLVEMSRDGFITHRFYAEKRFTKIKVDEMYRQWVRNSLTNTSVWSTVVLEKGGKVLGFMTYRIEDLSAYYGMNFVKWRMAALTKDDRGKSHGMDLFIGAMRYVYNQAGVVDSGLTIRNTHSFNLHTKLNFKLKCSSITLHKWFS